ncbi:MAG: IclR family transcriptional regulator [Acidimicrobiia bacterium]
MDTVATGVGVVDKVAAILDALGNVGPCSLGELTEATGIARPTAHRIATALEAHGLVGRNDDGRFRIGARVAELAMHSAVPPLAVAAQPVLDELCALTGESAQLFVRDGSHRVCVAVAEPRAGLRDTVPLGAVFPIDRGSGGQVLRAFAADAPAALAAVRKRGWAESVGERAQGVASVSAPVFDANGGVVAAISVSGPIDRLGRTPGKRLAAQVVAAAEELLQR